MKTKLIASCVNCNIHENQTFIWSVKGLNDDKNITLTVDNVLTPSNSKSFVLAPNILNGKQPYVIEVKIIAPGQYLAHYSTRGIVFKKVQKITQMFSISWIY